MLGAIPGALVVYPPISHHRDGIDALSSSRPARPLLREEYSGEDARRHSLRRSWKALPGANAAHAAECSYHSSYRTTLKALQTRAGHSGR